MLERSRSPAAYAATTSLADGRGRAAPHGLARAAVASDFRAGPSVGEFPRALGALSGSGPYETDGRRARSRCGAL
eukprot:2117001-Alexandrium_andersonii.AAC.1